MPWKTIPNNTYEKRVENIKKRRLPSILHQVHRLLPFFLHLREPSGDFTRVWFCVKRKGGNSLRYVFIWSYKLILGCNFQAYFSLKLYLFGKTYYFLWQLFKNNSSCVVVIHEAKPKCMFYVKCIYIKCTYRFTTLTVHTSSVELPVDIERYFNSQHTQKQI